MFHVMLLLSCVKDIILRFNTNTFHLWTPYVGSHSPEFLTQEDIRMIYIFIYNVHIVVYCHSELISFSYRYLSHSICVSIQFSSRLISIFYSGSCKSVNFSNQNHMFFRVWILSPPSLSFNMSLELCKKLQCDF